MRRFFLPFFGCALALVAGLERSFPGALPGHQALWNGDYPRAKSEFIAALGNDPASPERWFDLAEAQLQTGDRPGAKTAIDNGLRMSPRMPHVRMRAANLLLQYGDAEAAIKSSREALPGTSEYDEVVFQLWTRTGKSPAALFALGVQGDPGIARRYAEFLIATQRDADLLAAWTRLHPEMPRDTALTEKALDLLMRRKRWTEALRVGEPLTPLNGNLIRNGDFAWEPSGHGWDWRSEPATGVETRWQPDHTFHVHFTGEANAEFHQVWQQRPLPAGRYRFQAMVKTKALTTNEGFHFAIASPSVMATTEALAGDHEWTPLMTTFSIPSASAVDIRMSRRRSVGPDEIFMGDVWVRDVRLAKLNQGQ